MASSAEDPAGQRCSTQRWRRRHARCSAWNVHTWSSGRQSPALASQGVVQLLPGARSSQGTGLITLPATSSSVPQ